MPGIDPKIIDQYQTSGLTQKAFCSQHSISISSFQYHLRKSRTKQPDSSSGKFLRLFGNHDQQSKVGDATTIIFIRGRFTSSEIAEIVSTGSR